MIIKSIKLENIRSYTNEKIEFPQGSVLLAGDIGSGKSTILLSVEFALFGIMKGDVSGAQLLRHGCKEGSVELCMEVNNKEVIVKRTLKRNSSSISQESGFLIINGVKTDLVSKELKARILKILGYSESMLNKSKSLIYRYTVYTPQEDMKRIILSTPEERLDTLRSVFGIDKYKTIRENSTIYARELKRKISYIEGQTQDLDEIKEQLKTRTTRKTELESEEEKIIPHVKKAKDDVKKSQEVILKKEKEVDEIRKQRNEIRILETKIENSRRNIKTHEERIRTETERIAKLEEEVNGERKVSEEKLALKISELKNDISKQRTRLNDISKRFGQVEFLKSESEKTIKKISSLDKCPTCLQVVDEKHKHGIKDDNEKNILESKKSIETLQGEKEAITNTIDALEKKLSEYEKIREKAELFKLKIKMIEEKKIEIENSRNLVEEQRKMELKFNNEKKMLEEKIENAKVVEEEYLKLRHELLSLQKIEREEEIKLARIIEQKKSIDDIISGIKKQIEVKEELKKKISRMKEMHFFLTGQFENLIVNMEKHVFASIYQEFNELVSKWFSMLIGDENITLKLNNEFTPSLEQNGYETEIENLSGGEKTAVALSYRLALNKVINDMVSTINTKDLIILDEPTDGFSSEQLDRVHDVLEELKLPQVIIVSHEAKVEGFVDSVIRISKESHESKVI